MIIFTHILNNIKNIEINNIYVCICTHWLAKRFLILSFLISYSSNTKKIDNLLHQKKMKTHAINQFFFIDPQIQPVIFYYRVNVYNHCYTLNTFINISTDCQSPGCPMDKSIVTSICIEIMQRGNVIPVENNTSR